MKNSFLTKGLFCGIVILFIGAVLIPSISSDDPVFGDTIYVDDDAADPGWYDATHVKTIQEGVTNASAGDTVFVYNGTYYENVVVRKSINLVGEDRNKTIIDGDRKGHVVKISADWVNISGFRIQNSGFNPSAGIFIDSNHNHNTVTNNTILNNYRGTLLLVSSGNAVIDNIILNSSDIGIYLYYSGSNTLTGNVVSNSSDTGIYLSNSVGNILTDNVVSNNSYDIYSGYGIYLSDSGNTIMNSNSMLNNNYNFCVSGSSLDHYIQNIDTSNTVDGKPIYYWVNKNGGTIPSDAGYVGLVNSSHVIVENLNIVNNSPGVLFCNTTHSTISNISVSNNLYGIKLYCSNFNTIIGNNITGNTAHGIWLHYSNNNTITNNNPISSNYYSGICIDYSNNNTIDNNTVVTNSVYGIYLRSYSSDNIITNNNLSPHVGGTGIYLDSYSNNNTITDNAISDNSCGLCCNQASNNTIINNTITNNRNGIYLSHYSNNNTVSDNVIMNSRQNGIELEYYSNNNIISGNNISKNGGEGSPHYWGIEISGSHTSNNNIIYNNYFDNRFNVYDEGTNIWNITKTFGTNIIDGQWLGGNYWNDYTGSDLDGDGLGDTLLPYNSSGRLQNGGDWHPLVPVSGCELPEVIIKVGDHYGGGHGGYQVHVYNSTTGIEVYNAISDQYGETVFWLTKGGYDYQVSSAGIYSPEIPFTVEYCNDYTLEYKLSKVNIKVGDHYGGGHANYVVYVFMAGDIKWNGYSDFSDANGLTTFWVIQGDYEYLVYKNKVSSHMIGFTVAYCNDYTLEYELANITIHVQKSGNPAPGYTVFIYKNQDGLWGQQTTGNNGDATFYLIEGSYQYRVKKGSYASSLISFTVALPPPGDDKTITHNVP